MKISSSMSPFKNAVFMSTWCTIRPCWADNAKMVRNVWIFTTGANVSLYYMPYSWQYPLATSLALDFSGSLSAFRLILKIHHVWMMNLSLGLWTTVHTLFSSMESSWQPPSTWFCQDFEALHLFFRVHLDLNVLCRSYSQDSLLVCFSVFLVYLFVLVSWRFP